MIHLANDPIANRIGLRPVNGKVQPGRAMSPRSPGGHAWPFISRAADRPRQLVEQKPVAASGS